MSGFRPRISIFSALLLMTIVGMAIVIAQLWREVGPAREEIKRLRAEVGHLSIDDPKKAYAIAVPTSEEDTWKWRIYLPPGRTYTLHERSGRQLPQPSQHPGKTWFDAVLRAGSGGSSSGSAIQGELSFEAKLIQKDDRWVLVTNYTKSDGSSSTRGGGTDSIYPDEWLSERRSRPTRSDVPSVGQKEFEPGQPILLLHRMKPVITETPGGGYSSQMPDGPTEGFVLWIE
jgi:hypothetical protein